MIEFEIGELDLEEDEFLKQIKAVLDELDKALA